MGVIRLAALLTPYAALAVAVGWAHGLRGLAALSFFYVWAGAWVAFALAWGWAARSAGRWNVERVERFEDDEPAGPPDGVPEPEPAAAPAATRPRPLPAL